jgi:hypothetical protein
VGSYTGQGGPDYYYDITAYCEGEGSGSPDRGTEQTEPPDDTWTVMLYLNAEDETFEDTLRDYITDLEGVIAGKTDFLTITVLYDGPAESDIRTGTVRMVIQPDGNYTSNVNFWNQGELNMGNPRTLAAFVNWSMDRFPAENYFLALDDHGDGVYGISVDKTSNDMLTPEEIYTALKFATINGRRTIDIMDYEACLMGTTENAYDVREWVDYVVFFEQISWGIDTYPQYFRDLAPTDEPREVGERIITRYSEGAYLANGGRGFPHAVSLVDTGEMTAVREADRFFFHRALDVGDHHRYQRSPGPVSGLCQQR